MKLFFKISLLLSLLPLMCPSSQLVAQTPCSICTEPVVSTGGTESAYTQISPKGRCIAVANSGTGTVSLFSFKKKCCTIGATPFQTITNPGAYGLAYSPNGKILVVSGGFSDTLTVYRVHDECDVDDVPRQVINFPTAPLRYPQAVTFSPDGRFLAVAFFGTGVGAPSTLAIYAVQKGCTLNPTPVNTVSLGVSANNFGIAYSPNGNWFAAVNKLSQTFTLYSVDKKTGALTATATTPTNGFSQGIAFSPNNHCIAVGNTDGSLNIFSFNSQGEVTFSQSLLQAEGLSTTSLAYSNDGKCLIAVNNGSNNIGIFEANNDSCTIANSGTFTSVPGSPFIITEHNNCFVVSGFGALGTNGTLNPFKLNCPSTETETEKSHRRDDRKKHKRSIVEIEMPELDVENEIEIE